MNQIENTSRLESKFDQSSVVDSDQVEQNHTNEMEKDLKLLAAYPDLNVNIRTKYYSDNIGKFYIISLKST